MQHMYTSGFHNQTCVASIVQLQKANVLMLSKFVYVFKFHGRAVVVLFN